MWAPLRKNISQGDIFQDIPFPIIRFEGGVVSVETENYPGMLLTFDCEYDKKIVPVALLGQVRLLSDVKEGARKPIREGTVVRTLFLPKSEMMDESFVEFTNVASVSKVLLQSYSENGRRIASIDHDSRILLQQKLAAFYGIGRKTEDE